jgi:hypothetical protein
MSTKILTSFFLVWLLFLPMCKKQPPEPPDKPKYKQQIFLSVVDTSVTELTLKVAIAESVEQRAFIVKRDTQTILSALCSALDTTFTDTALLPNRAYTYKAYRLKNNRAIDSSQTLTITTRTYSPFVLSVLDTGINDATLKIAINDNSTNRQYQLTRNGQLVTAGYVNGNDTTLTDKQLAPLTTYTYTAYRSANGQAVDTSNTLQLTTHDDTTRNFTLWRMDTLGDGNASYLGDVAVINENNIWVVGHIQVLDTNGDYQLHNLARWDGTQWSITKVYYTYQGQLDISELHSVFAFNANDIWVGSTQPMHWNGTVWEQFDIPASIFYGYINKIWGTSSNNVYIVGTNGAIAHFDGVGWSAMQSGTTLALTDILGVSSTEIYVCGINQNYSLGIILKGNGESWQTLIQGGIIDTSQIFHTGLYGELSGLWRDNNSTMYAVGNLMYQYKNKKWDYVRSLPGNTVYGNPNYRYGGFLNSVRGNASNDILIAGEINTLQHFNGVKWSEVGIPYYPLQYGLHWYRCVMQGNFALVIGSKGSRGMVMQLRR